MTVFEAEEFNRHEEVAFFDDRKSGLKAIVAIHSTNLGPALGGARMFAYATSEDALTDVLRLSRGMSYKNAMAGLPFGGGKSVIVGNPARDKKDNLLFAFASAVNSLGGRYITSVDMGMHPEDLPKIQQRTNYVAGFVQQGRTGGDPSPKTAMGVFHGLKAAVKHRLDKDTTKGLIVAIQGAGAVGRELAQELHAEGAKLFVSDVDAAALDYVVSKCGATAVATDKIYSVECDIYSPCAFGGTLNDDTIPGLKASVVAGCANNQLGHPQHGAMLRARGILYAPDYVINAGGAICVAAQIKDWTDAEIDRRTLTIPRTLAEIFERADAENLPTNVIADRMAEQTIARGPIPAVNAAE